MAKRGALKVPVIGVALPKWSLARLHNRVTDSIKQSGGIDNQRAFNNLLSLLKYVSGDYNDPNTFTGIKEALGSARNQAHYLAIPLTNHLRRCPARWPALESRFHVILLAPKTKLTSHLHDFAVAEMNFEIL
jgi:Glucose-6-phosphate dehydrogenase, NAD binding domain